MFTTKFSLLNDDMIMVSCSHKMHTKASMAATLGLWYATKLAAMDSCFVLIRPRQHGIANKMAHGFPRKKKKKKESEGPAC